MTKREEVRILLTPAQKSALQAIARADGEPISVTMRRLIRAEAERRGLWQPAPAVQRTGAEVAA